MITIVTCCWCVGVWSMVDRIVREVVGIVFCCCHWVIDVVCMVNDCLLWGEELR